MRNSSRLARALGLAALLSWRAAGAAEIERSPELSRAILAQRINGYAGIDISRLPEFIVRDVREVPADDTYAGLAIMHALTRPNGVARLQNYLRPAQTAYNPELGQDAAFTMRRLASDLAKIPQGKERLGAQIARLEKTVRARGKGFDKAAINARMSTLFEGSSARSGSSREQASLDALPTVDVRAPAEASREDSRVRLYKANAPRMSTKDEFFKRYSPLAARSLPYSGPAWFWQRGHDDEEATRSDWKRLESLGNEFVALASDPGIFQRLDEFAAFVRAEDDKKLSPWELRERFKRRLGTKTVYRALALSEREVAEILKQGMLSGMARSDRSRDPLHGGYGRFDDHMRGRNIERDPWISVTDFPELGVNVAYQISADFGGHHVLEGRQDIHVFKLNLWLLDLIDPHAARAEEMSYFDLRGNVRRIPLDSRAESLVFYKIDRSQIESITRVTGEDLIPVRTNKERQRAIKEHERVMEERALASAF